MDPQRHRTQKKSTTDGNESPPMPATHVASEMRFKTLLEAGAREAYARPWHRIERGLRLNRIRIFIEQIASQYKMTPSEKEELFIFLQKALDNRLLNTLKVVQYDVQTQRIQSIKGLEIKRDEKGILKASFNTAKVRPDSTRKKKKGGEIPSVSTTVSESNKIEEKSQE
jgi:hypothetical protein